MASVSITHPPGPSGPGCGSFTCCWGHSQLLVLPFFPHAVLLPQQGLLPLGCRTWPRELFSWPTTVPEIQVYLVQAQRSASASQQKSEYTLTLCWNCIWKSFYISGKSFLLSTSWLGTAKVSSYCEALMISTPEMCFKHPFVCYTLFLPLHPRHLPPKQKIPGSCVQLTKL